MIIETDENKIITTLDMQDSTTIYSGDCKDLLSKLPDASVDMIITSPPYCMRKAYENPSDDINTFKKQHEIIFDDIYRILKSHGSICWQIGYHVSDACVIPLDYIVYDLFTDKSKDREEPLILRNRIIWTYGHGLNSKNRFSGRHETILWFTKGKQTTFNLDDVRVPQKYPGKKSYKGANKGKLSGNPLGKNPADVWDIPNVKANHIEKTEHPCQFPVAIPQRLIRALSNENDLILDPFMGVGSTAVAAFLEKRRFVGAEIHDKYVKIAEERLRDLKKGIVNVREDIPAKEPNPNSFVAKLPEEFRKVREDRE